MRILPLLIASVGLWLTGCATQAAKAPEPALEVVNPNASIPFASLGGIKSWNAREDGSLVIEGTAGRLYRATFMNSCSDIKFAGSTIPITTDSTGDTDRFSSVLVNGRRCPFASLDEVIDPASRASAAPSATVQGGALAPPPAR